MITEIIHNFEETTAELLSEAQPYLYENHLLSPGQIEPLVYFTDHVSRLRLSTFEKHRSRFVKEQRDCGAVSQQLHLDNQ